MAVSLLVEVTASGYEVLSILGIWVKLEIVAEFRSCSTNFILWVIFTEPSLYVSRKWIQLT